jgi:hypothetical protein
MQGAIQQRTGAWHPPAHWDFEAIEYRGFMLATLFLVPLLRYTQDTPEDKNALLARDFAALGSATMLYLFLRKVLSKHISELSKPEEIAKLPKFLQGLGKALGADAKDPIQKEKNHLLSYIPAQIVSLTASALIGPAIGSQAMQHLKQVHQWAQSPHKKEHLKESWQNQTPEDRQRLSLEAVVTAGGFLALLLLAYEAMGPYKKKAMGPCEEIVATTLKERVLNAGIRLMDYDLQAIVTSLLGGIGLAKLSSALCFPNTKKEQAHTRQKGVNYPEDHSLKGDLKHTFFQAQKDDNGELTFKLKAPAVGVALMGATYMSMALWGLIHTIKHHNNPKELDRLYSYNTAYHALHWLLPSLILPTIRYSRDPKEKRDELYIRDFTHSWLGMVMYWAAKFSTLKAIEHFHWVALPKAVENTEVAKRIQKEAKYLLASTVGLMTQIPTVVFLAPKFSHDFVNYANQPILPTQEPEATVPSPARP